MRRPDAVCSQYDRPNGVALSFQVRTNSIEPSVGNCVFNLLAKNELRATLADEPEHFGPEMARVFDAESFARATEGLAGTGAGPNREIIGDSSESKSDGPASDSSEQVYLREAFKVAPFDILNVPIINHARRDQAIVNQFAQPRRRVRVVFVIVIHHFTFARSSPVARASAAHGQLLACIVTQTRKIPPVGGRYTA